MRNIITHDMARRIAQAIKNSAGNNKFAEAVTVARPKENPLKCEALGGLNTKENQTYEPLYTNAKPHCQRSPFDSRTKFEIVELIRCCNSEVCDLNPLRPYKNGEQGHQLAHFAPKEYQSEGNNWSPEKAPC
ncbi:MAG: hypothetical protein OEZ68_22125 [Gammaproteobacteria bacterium]|nr:hypothetical protein [Gammaproteobacteria bacterium]MDH5803485.1 hypothetical protein [Gammaproteobacteria bacterium]